MLGKVVISFAMIFMIFSHSYAEEQRIMAFCAAITKPPVEEAAEAFTKVTGISVDMSFGGSGAMLSQLKLARRGDVYVAASPDFMVKAERDRVIDTKSLRDSCLPGSRYQRSSWQPVGNKRTCRPHETWCKSGYL